MQKNSENNGTKEIGLVTPTPGQSHDGWCPGSLSRQVINSHGIN